MADELGVVPNTLEHHFGTKEELLDELLGHLTEQRREDQVKGIRRIVEVEVHPSFGDYYWAALTDVLRPQDPMAKIFFELVGASMRNRERYRNFLSRALHDWINVSVEVLVANEGISEERARTISHVVVAMSRGFMLSSVMADESDEAALQEATRLSRTVVEFLLHDGTGADSDGVQMRSDGDS